MSGGPSHVTVRPSGIVVAVEPGETLLAAAQRQGLTWPTICGGQASCRTCYVVVEDGAEHLPPPAELEQRAIADIERVRPAPGGVRLACQAVPTGDLVVTRRGVRRIHDVPDTGGAL